MSGGRFKIIDSVKKAYRLNGREAVYLGKALLLPLLAEVVCQLNLAYRAEPVTPFGLFLWTLPSKVLFAWFLCLQTRLILLGERMGQLPADPLHIERRKREVAASIIIFLLFSMAMTSFAGIVYWLIETKGETQSGFATAVSCLILGATFWGIRFGVAHIVAAVGYPVRKFIYRVDGVEFSFRLIGLAILSILPAQFVMGMILMMIFPASQEDISSVPSAVSEPMGMIAMTFANAACVYAVHEILSRHKKGAA